MKSFTYKIGAQGARDRAKQFMGNAIVRGIVELITNSDAAYAALGMSQPKKRPITIFFNSTDRWFEVRDRAGGMSPHSVEEKFTEGGATSVERQRGYFGLGAKDCAVFGSLHLKTIDQRGTLSEVSIPGDFENCTWDSRRATVQDYESMHGTTRRTAGTVVRINVDSLEQGGARFPRFENLVRDLRSHYALRALHQRNRVTLKSVGRKKASENLTYARFPWEGHGVQLMHDGALEIEGYPDSQPKLSLFKLPEPITGELSSESFEGFLLIGTKDIADYGFTLAGLERRDHAKRLVGRVEDSYIQILLRDYRSTGASEQNPRPVVSQDRRPKDGGLDSAHPYTKALFAALIPILTNALEALQSEGKGAGALWHLRSLACRERRGRAQERSGISEALRAANEEAGRRLSQILDAEGGTPTPKPLPAGLYFLPPSKVLTQDQADWESLSLYLIPEGSEDGLAVVDVGLCLEDPNICQIEGSTATLRERSANAHGHRATIKLRAGNILGRTTLTAFVDGRTAKATVSVEETPPPPMLFQFERSRYSVQPSRRRTVKVLVPEFLIQDDADPIMALSLHGSSDGVVIRGLWQRNFYDCEFDGVRLAYMVPFEIEGRQVGARVKLTARFQGQHAEAELIVGGGTLRVQLDDHEASPPDQRAKVYNVGERCSDIQHENEACLHVFARHPRVEPYLGEPKVLAGGIFWNLNDSPGFRAMYADCIAEAVAQFQLTGSGIDSNASPEDMFPSFWNAKKKALAVMQQIYIDNDRWRSQVELLDFAE